MASRTARASEIVDTYVKALFRLAEEKDVVKEVGLDLKKLEERFREHPLKMQRLLAPLFATREQREELAPLLKGLSVYVQNFVYLLQRYKKLKLFFLMVDAYDRHMQEFFGFVPVEICAAFPFNESKKEQIRKKVKNLINENILLYIKEDPTLLGGFQVQIKSILIDCSIRSTLNVLHQKIKG